MIEAESQNDGLSTQVSYKYHSKGVRVSATRDGVETRYLIDDNFQSFPQVLEEYHPSDINSTSTAYSFGLQRISSQSGDQTQYYLTDGLGSKSALVDSRGEKMASYIYDAFGNPESLFGNLKNEFLYAGEQYEDSLNLLYLRARYYDSSTGRFVSSDPFPGFVFLPMTQNDYLYVGSNPVNYVDPSGLSGASFSEYGVVNRLKIIRGAFLSCIRDIALNQAKDQLENQLEDLTIKAAGDYIIGPGAEALGGIYVYVTNKGQYYVGKTKNPFNIRLGAHARKLAEEGDFITDVFKIGIDQAKQKKGFKITQIEQALIDIADNVFPITPLDSRVHKKRNKIRASGTQSGCNSDLVDIDFNPLTGKVTYKRPPLP